MNGDFSVGIHIDFHTMPGIDNINDFDAEDFAQTLAYAHAKYVNIAAQCVEGFCYYPTRAGTVYPGLQRDIMGEAIAACRKRGIKVAAYLCCGADATALYAHPEWRKVRKDGRAEEDEFVDGERNSVLYKACFHTGYAEYKKQLISEVLQYDIDGVFCDLMFHEPCYCAACKSTLLARGANIDDDAAVLAFRDETLRKFCTEVRALVAAKDEKIHTFFNSGTWWEYDFQDHIEIESLPGHRWWTYEYLPALAGFARACRKDTLFMTGRFQLGWGDFGGIKSEESLRYDMCQAVSIGAGFMVGDHLNPGAKLLRPLYKTIRKINEEFEEYEAQIGDAAYAAEIAVLCGCESYELFAETKGICRILSELKYGYNVILPSFDFSPYKLLVVTSGTAFTAPLAEKIAEFLRRGGKAITCGTAGLDERGVDFALPQWKSAFSYEGKDDRTDAFFTVSDLADGKFDGVPWAQYEPRVLVKAADAAVLAQDVHPYFNQRCDGKYNYKYIPPEKPSGYCAAACANDVAHVSFDLFTAYGKHFATVHKEIVRELLARLLPAPQMTTSGLPDYARVTLRTSCTGANVCVLATFPECKDGGGVIEDRVWLPSGAKICVCGNYARAYEARTKEEIPLRQQGDYVELTLPRIDGFAVICLRT